MGRPGLARGAHRLHELEFIETRRHWFTSSTPHDTLETVNVLNLVEERRRSSKARREPSIHSSFTMLKPSLSRLQLRISNFAYRALDRKDLCNDQSVCSQRVASLRTAGGEMINGVRLHSARQESRGLEGARAS